MPSTESAGLEDVADQPGGPEDAPLTCRDLVHQYLPCASDRDVMFILWNMTPWPCGDPRGELARLAAICAPVRKRGWFRKLCREAGRIDQEVMRVLEDARTTDPANAMSQPPTGEDGGDRA